MWSEESDYAMQNPRIRLHRAGILVEGADAQLELHVEALAPEGTCSPGPRGPVAAFRR